MVGRVCASANVAVFLPLHLRGPAGFRAGAHTLNCSFILCRRAPPLIARIRHFLCTALTTCFLS